METRQTYADFQTSPTPIERYLPVFCLVLYAVAATAGAFEGGLWAGLGIGNALILFFFVWHIDKKPPAPDAGLTRMVLTALLITACFNFQSSQPGRSWEEWVKLGTIFLPLLLLSGPRIPARAVHSKFFSILPVAMAVGGLALALTLYLKSRNLTPRQIALELAHYNRGFSYLVILSFPVMAGLWLSKKRWLIVPFLLLLLIPAELTESRASKLALVLALPVVVGAHFWPVLVRRAMAMAPVMAVAWPFAAQEFFLKYYDLLPRLPDSWRARIEIWDYMSYRIWERPVLGWGLGTSATLPFQEPHGGQYVFTVLPAGHPHNVMVQLWAELGLPGLALGLAFAFLTLRKAGRVEPRLVPFALGAWTACFCLTLIAYNFWTDSLFAAFALTALAFAMLERQITPSQP